MIKDMTIGQYYPADSMIHRLDPRVKLLGTLLFIISVFLIKSIPAFVLGTVFLFGVILLSKVPVKFMLKGLRAIMVIIILTVMFSLFFTPGETVVKVAFITITKEGIRTAITMVFRLTYLIVGSSVMTLTTTPNSLTDGLERGLGWMKVLHVPVHEIAMMMSIALRFIPILMEELDRIMRAQKARGADFDNGSIIEKAKGLIPLIVPLFVAAIRRADELAMAMDARCYNGGEGRTRMKPLAYTGNDRKAYVIILAYFVVMIAMRVVL